MPNKFAKPEQLLPREAYLSETWFEAVKELLFSRSWTYACTEAEVANPGDFVSFVFMDYPLFVVRGADGALRAFHNICRHRGCEIVEDKGNCGTTLMCPYHRWTYELSGELRSRPNEESCFDDAKDTLGLKPAAVGVNGGLVYVNPDDDPPESLEAWFANMGDHAWPHRFDDGSLEYAGEVVYEMHCNWKVFYENAIDGYHLGYLHDNTLGKLYPDRNVWKPVGRNVAWYSTEREGPPQSNSILSAQISDGYGARRLAGHNEAFYPGVVMLFPLTILSPSPWGFYVSTLDPVAPELTYMRTKGWAPAGSTGRFDISGVDKPVRLADLDEHPMESGNFQIEDMWIVEKIQRALRSPRFEIGPLADGDGAEGPIMHFQQSVLDYLGPAVEEVA